MRDAAAKAVYGRLFSWLIVQINRLLAPELSRAAAKNTIGALPIPPPRVVCIGWLRLHVKVPLLMLTSFHFVLRVVCFPFSAPTPAWFFFFLCFLLLLL